MPAKTAADVAQMDADLETEMLGTGTEAEKPVSEALEKGSEDADLEFGASEEEKPEAKAKDEPAAKLPQKPKDGKEAKKAGEQPEQQKTVPHEALHAERKKVEEARAALEQERLSKARLEERISLINEALEQQAKLHRPPPPVQEQLPAFGENPIEVGEWLQKMELERQQRDQERAERETHQQRAREQQQAEDNYYNQVVSEAREQWVSFREENPNADSAYQHLLSARAKQLLLTGIPKHEVNLHLQREEAQLAIVAKKANRSISDYIMGYAESYGWTPPAETDIQHDTNGDGRQRDANGRFIPTEREQQTSDNADKLTRLQKAQDASESLSTAGGSSPGSNKISLESLDRMDNKEFHSLIAKLVKKGGEGAVDDALAKMSGL